MHLCDFLDPELIFIGLDGEDKQSLLAELAELTARHIPGVDPKVLLALLRAREEESSTGVGSGVAIPHCFLDGLERSRCVLAQVPGGVAFDAIDDAPVLILFLLLSPPSARMTHLRLLARISRVAHREGFARDAAAATSTEELHELLTCEDRSHAG